MSVSKLMFNAQALGVFIGGLVSGLWGDKVGRVSAVRIGIFIYSTAIILNIFATSVELFALLRLIAGIGLAGEFAASVTLLSEMTIQERRGVLSSAVYFFGVVGGLLATGIQSYFNWKILFLIGGIAGFFLLFLRKTLVDSMLFLIVKQKKTLPRGSLKLLLFNPHSLVKILKLTCCFLPFWLAVFFVNFAPEIAKGVGLTEKISLPHCLFLFYLGSLVGVFFFSCLGRLLKSHKKPIFIGYILILSAIMLLCLSPSIAPNFFSNLFLLVGLSTGYCGVCMTILTENFGTNQRSTGTTFASNLGRTSFIFINWFLPLMMQTMQSVLKGAILGGLILIIISIFCLSFVKETYGSSMEYTE